MSTTEELLHCPYCGSIQKLAFSFHEARDKKHRYGRYDGAIYCRNCYSYGPRVRSEDLQISRADTRNEEPTVTMMEALKSAAVELWNRRVSDEYEVSNNVND